MALRLTFGLLATAAAIPAATAADGSSPFDAARPPAERSNSSHLHWRPIRPIENPQTFDDARTPGVASNAALSKPTAPVATWHRDPNVTPAQRLTAAEQIANPFADEPDDTKTKKNGAKADAKSSAPSTLGPAEATLPEPSPPAAKSSVPEPAPAKSLVDPFAPEVPKTEPKSQPKTDREPSPFPPPPGNDVTTPKTPFVPPAAITPAPNPMSEENTTTGKTACDNERALLLKNTIDMVPLDIAPKLVGKNDVLPGECTLGDAQFVPRTWYCLTYTWKASALCHKPLYFEEVAVERYGHSRGPILDPLVSAAHFFVTVPLLPYKMGVEPPHECEYTLGYYRPGSCAPWIIDGIPISLRGMALECTFATGAAFAIP